MSVHFRGGHAEMFMESFLAYLNQNFLTNLMSLVNTSENEPFPSYMVFVSRDRKYQVNPNDMPLILKLIEF